MAAQSNGSDWARQLTNMSMSPDSMQRQAETFWAHQDKILVAFRKHAEAWCERRHVGTAAALDCATGLCRNTEPTDVSRLWSEWMTGVMGRVAEDARDQFALSLQVMRELADGYGLPAADFLTPPKTAERTHEKSVKPAETPAKPAPKPHTPDFKTQQAAE